MLQVALLISAVCSISLGTLVLLNNPRSALFKLYFVLSATGALWMAVNAIVSSSPDRLSPDTLLRFAQCITPLALVTSLSFYAFLKLFVNKKFKPVDAWALIPTILVSLFSFSSFNVYFDSNGELALGGLYYFYLAALVFNIGLIFYTLYSRNAAKLENDPTQRIQLSYLRIGAFSSIIPTVIFGSVIPLFSTSSISNLGPLFGVIFTISAGIAIARHRLFDIKFYAVRAAMYLLTVLFLGVIYIAPALYIMAIGIMGFPFVPIKFVFGVLFATIIALYFNNLRVWFNTITVKIFFRDMYDPALVLGELNKVLVSSIELNRMLRSSSDLIASIFKAEYCVFALNKTTSTNQRFIGNNSKKLSIGDLGLDLGYVSQDESNVTIVDYLGDEQKALKRVLSRNNAAVLIKLPGSNVDQEEDLGYILLGFKKSGNAYNNKDVTTLEAMADALTIAIQNALHFEEIQKFNVTLQQRVDDATRQLTRTNAKLVALDESKDDFISMASHQLRTPLTAVKGYLSMVLDEDAGKVTPTQRKMLGQAFLSSQRMVFLIADLLNVSRLKTGKFVIEPTDVDLSELIDQEIVQLRELAAGHGLELDYKKPKTFPTMRLDETKTRQVVMNFIDNAVHYTPSGGHVSVELVDKPHSVELLVRDDGIGVPKADQHHLFTKFYRAANARRERPDGTGLGLFMAKKVIVAQGGAVIFNSHERKGSVFGFSIPKKPVDNH